jgi:hypothetical protein
MSDLQTGQIKTWIHQNTGGDSVIYKERMDNTILWIYVLC